jgi:hypothetical protein
MSLAQWRGAQWGTGCSAFPTYQGVDLHCLEQRIFLSVRHDLVVERCRVEGSARVVNVGRPVLLDSRFRTQ